MGTHERPEGEPAAPAARRSTPHDGSQVRRERGSGVSPEGYLLFLVLFLGWFLAGRTLPSPWGIVVLVGGVVVVLVWGTIEHAVQRHHRNQLVAGLWDEAKRTGEPEDVTRRKVQRLDLDLALRRSRGPDKVRPVSRFRMVVRQICRAILLVLGIGLALVFYGSFLALPCYLFVRLMGWAGLIPGLALGIAVTWLWVRRALARGGQRQPIVAGLRRWIAHRI